MAHPLALWQPLPGGRVLVKFDPPLGHELIRKVSSRPIELRGTRAGLWTTAEVRWPLAWEELRRIGIQCKKVDTLAAEYSEAARGANAAAKRFNADRQASASTQALADFDWSGFPEWAAQNLKIKRKGSLELIPFVLNPAQRKAFDQAWAQWQRTGRVRQNDLKNRQVGLSTMWQGLFFYVALMVPQVEALVTAHRDDSSDAVFRRTKTFLFHCPIQKETVRNNKKEIQWEGGHGSAVRVSMAGGDEDFGRSEARNCYHASEAALYNEKGLEAYANIMASIADEPGTIVVRETTAKGQNWFYEAWTAPELEGFENFFTGWLDDDTCRNYEMGLSDPVFARMPRSWTEDEPRIVKIAEGMGLGFEEIEAALVWRRRAIPSKCRGSVKIFNREHPTVPKDAFTSTGGHVFDIEMVNVERERCQRAETQNPAPRYSILVADPENPGGYRVVANSEGPLRIWKEPEAGEAYLIAGDFGRGRNVSPDGTDPDKLDYTTFRVVKEHEDADGKHEEVAVWHGRMDPDAAADQMAALGRKYNLALLIPETNHYGMIVVSMLVNHRKYPRVFRKERIDKATARPVKQSPEAHWMEYGWWTGATDAKENMIEWLHEGLRDGRFLIHEPEFWDEARTYVRDEDGKTNAESGKHDDRVMGWAIVASVIELHPKRRKEQPKPFAPVKAEEKDGELTVQIDDAWYVKRAHARSKKAKAKRNELA